MRGKQQSSALQGSAQFKRGVVEKIDSEKPWRVRVKFQDEDGVQSFWLSIMSAGAKGNRHAHTPREGEQVACLVDWRGEDGVILGGLYSEADARPETAKENHHVEFEDGAIHEHDPKTHVHRITLPQQGTLFFAVGDMRLKLTKDGGVVNKPIVLGQVDEPQRRKK
ncbi:phage baseplate assembly protein V [Methylocystis sp. S23]